MIAYHDLVDHGRGEIYTIDGSSARERLPSIPWRPISSFPNYVEWCAEQSQRPVVSFDGTVDESPQQVRLGNITMKVNFVPPFTPREQQTIAAHGGLMIQLGPAEYLVAGRELTIIFLADTGLVGTESIREGT